ncbi:MAG TPA: DUF2961 domain-containing protein, partial [Firmicutes bacterium]|nr:DUF2961 domain-containing protein [Bacillota bacterium]
MDFRWSARVNREVFFRRRTPEIFRRKEGEVRYQWFAGLGGLHLAKDVRTRSISAENPTGEKGGGAKAVPDEASPARRLGVGWKVRPCITLPAGETVELARIEGPGTIQHIWMTVKAEAYRDCVLRFYWDGEETPSVEVPLGDFFANGHGLRYNVNSLPVAVNPKGGFNCYWPMPFRKSALITIENQRWEDITGFFYQITYALGEVPEEALYFHAQWRRSMTSKERPEHTILDGVRGRGHYVGTFLAWTQLSNGWWGEGEVKFYIDGDTDHPTICGTGTEDYFGGAWCFGETYSTAFLGYPLWRKEPGEVPRHAMYRWHIMDPIVFRQDIRVTIQALGWWPDGTFQPLTDDIASVAYWYQAEPHSSFPELP